MAEGRGVRPKLLEAYDTYIEAFQQNQITAAPMELLSLAKSRGQPFEVVRISFVFCFVLLSYMIPSFEMLQFSVARSYLHFPQITSLFLALFSTTE